MSLSILPNQALAEAESPANKCNTNYYLPSQRGDNFTLQGFVTNNDSQSIANDSFGAWSLGAGFSSAGGGLLNYNGSQGSPTTAVSPVLNLTAGNVYLFSATVTVTNAGSCSAIQGAQIYVNGIAVPMPKVNAGQGSSQSFVVSWYYLPASVGSDVIEITFNNGSIQFNVEGLSMYQFTMPLVLAYDLNGNYIQSLDPVYVKYFTVTDFTGSTNFGGSLRFDIQFNLNELPDGCYALQIYDGSSNVANGNFLNSNNWTVGANWTIANNTASYTGNSSAQRLETNINVNGGVTYTLMFEASNLNGTNALALQVAFNDASTQSQIYSHNGFLVFQFTAPNDATGIATLSFIPDPVVGHTSNFSISAVSCVFTDSFFNSNNINFRTTWQNTHLFSANNNDGAFNFDYSQGLTHYMRLWSRLKYNEYNEEVDEYNFSDNSNVLMNSYIEKIYEVIIGDAAEFVHDCLSMLRINDNFYVDGNPYIRTGNYTLKQRKSTELSAATFDIKPVAGVGKNWAVNG